MRVTKAPQKQENSVCSVSFAAHYPLSEIKNISANYFSPPVYDGKKFSFSESIQSVTEGSHKMA